MHTSRSTPVNSTHCSISPFRGKRFLSRCISSAIRPDNINPMTTIPTIPLLLPRAVLQERQLIRMNRELYLNQAGQPLKSVDPLLNAGVLLEGGIIGYDSNVNTGGLGAQSLGIGGDTQYRRDMVTVYLRAVSVTTGEVLASVTTHKTVFSIALNTNLYRYVAFAKLLQIEGGITTNEPVELAVKQ